MGECASSAQLCGACLMAVQHTGLCRPPRLTIAGTPAQLLDKDEYNRRPYVSAGLRTRTSLPPLLSSQASWLPTSPRTGQRPTWVVNYACILVSHGKYSALVSDSRGIPSQALPTVDFDSFQRYHTTDATHKAQLENIRLRLSAASFFLILNLNVLVSARSDRVRLSPMRCRPAT
ncbi:hypothetical protein BC826DRAFT_227699 [Russula brevipes]|nr:hypothetical protein BC826DRAFT_227699 [Russula brevipes]